MPVILFSCLIALARTSSTMLHKGGERQHSFLVPDPNWESIWSFTIKYDVCCGIFLNVLYQVEEVPFYSYHECLLELVRCVF